ncbi:prepilin-type N-terminal cleavage/methylation domain-containing protein [Gluconacetobacter tumulisoli]|uniref:prepilin-type N-terminal cleavage/methylation domain-containing protein n=1 Tax=Gluconacetobacter tumulisoli TaxID=1286189 RepID=UPI0016034B7F|nr:prepilin-type N-terminal cleavage/methylation domain-containing protein [Gluconacetobacter tumulisoli]
MLETTRRGWSKGPLSLASPHFPTASEGAGRIPPGIAGFTLLETIVVLVVAGLLLGLVVERGPLHSARADFNVQRARVLALLRMARLDAQLDGASVSVKFEPVSGALVEIARHRVVRRVALARGAGILTSADGAFVFFSDGTARQGAWRLSVEGYGTSLRLDPLTGRILVDA